MIRPNKKKIVCLLQQTGGDKHEDFETRGRWVGVFHLQNFNKYHDTNWVVPNARTVILKSTKILIWWYHFTIAKFKKYIFIKK